MNACAQRLELARDCPDLPWRETPHGWSCDVGGFRLQIYQRHPRGGWWWMLLRLLPKARPLWGRVEYDTQEEATEAAQRVALEQLGAAA